MCCPISFLTEQGPERLQSLGPGLMESFFSLGPALPWLLHSLGYIRGTVRERPAARDAQGGQGEGGGERERESCKSESEKQNEGRIGQKGDKRSCRL